MTGIEPAWPAWKFEIEPLRAFYFVSLYPNAVTLLSYSFRIVPAVSVVLAREWHDTPNPITRIDTVDQRR